VKVCGSGTAAGLTPARASRRLTMRAATTGRSSIAGTGSSQAKTADAAEGRSERAASATDSAPNSIS